MRKAGMLLMRMLRILKRNIRDAFKSVFRNFSLSIASITCSTITLILVAIALVVSGNVNNATSELKKDLTIEVFLNLDVTQSDIEHIKTQISNLPNVKPENINYINADVWKSELIKESADIEAILTTLDTNPLRNSFEVSVDDVNELSETTQNIKKINGVFDAKYGEGKAENFIKIFDVIEKVTIIIVVALIIVTAFLISNTIKLTIFSRRNEIEIMRLVGTSNTVIRLPFLFEGFILGIIGSIIPALLTIYGYVLAYDKLGGYIYSNIIPLIKPFNFVLFVSLALMVLGALVGMFGSYRAVRKYLKI